MLTTRFFNLPEEADLLKNLIGQITAMGGGDDPEDGLEALAFAMRSDWDKEGMKKRHVIVVWSDAATHPLGYGREACRLSTADAKNIWRTDCMVGQQTVSG